MRSAADTILVADDDPGIRFALSDYLQIKGFDALVATSCQEAENVVRQSQPSLALLDYDMPDGTALALMARLRQLGTEIPVIVVSGNDDVAVAVRAVREGAVTYLTKPLRLDALADTIRSTLAECARSSTGSAGDLPHPFVGTSDAIRRLEEEVRSLVDVDRPLLLQGETGTGKGTLARWLYRQCQRRDQSFVAVNCAGLSENLLASELLGHERGAFTGAVASKVGLIEAADRGVLLLDEIGDMDLAIQPKVLTVLEEQRFARLGSVEEREVDIRLLAATNQDLRQLVDAGAFRGDLYYRISTLLVTIPPLRERREDIPIIAEQVLRKLASDLGRPSPELGSGAVDRLRHHAWPGNIRELKNVLERAVFTTRRDHLEASDIRLDTGVAVGPAESAPSADTRTLAEVERAHIAAALERAGGRVGDAAGSLGVPRSTLYSKIKRLGLVR